LFSRRIAELEQFSACFRVARVCQRQLGFLVTYLKEKWRNTLNTGWRCSFRTRLN